jgi:DNA-binding YbaB/EbfC family protein
MASPDIKELLKMAQEMQKSMKEAHEDLTRQQYVGEAGGGLVTIKMNGSREIPKGGVHIDPKALQEDKEVLEDLIAAAANSASRKIEKASEQKMVQLTKNLGIPGSGTGEDNR